MEKMKFRNLLMLLFMSGGLYADLLTIKVHNIAQATTCMLYIEKKVSIKHIYNNLDYHKYKLKQYATQEMNNLLASGYNRNNVTKLVVKKIDKINNKMKDYSWQTSKRYEKFCMPIIER